MSNQIQPFDFNSIQVRVLTDEHGNPWFLGADVCAILGTATNHIREYLDADEITNIRSTDIAQNGGKAPVFRVRVRYQPLSPIHSSGRGAQRQHVKEPQ